MTHGLVYIPRLLNRPGLSAFVRVPYHLQVLRVELRSESILLLLQMYGGQNLPSPLSLMGGASFFRVGDSTLSQTLLQQGLGVPLLASKRGEGHFLQQLSRGEVILIVSPISH
jgi:hypothetical protein